MGGDYSKCLRCCHGGYDGMQFDMLVWGGGAMSSVKGRYFRSAEKCLRLGRRQCGRWVGVSWPNAFGLEPVVNEQEGRPIAGMTIDRMVQQTDLGLL